MESDNSIGGNGSVRLQKYMADCGVDSRRHCETHIVAGRVAVNGTIVTELGTKVIAGQDKVTFDGKLLKLPQERCLYLMFNKPRGYLVTASDTHGRKTIYKLLYDIKTRVFPVGRLDMDTDGLLLLTNDGQFANKLMHPSNEIEKEYDVVVWGEITDDAIDALRNGIAIEDGFVTAPATVRKLKPTETNTSRLSVTIHEGHKRQVRMMMRAVGHTVKQLTRVREGKVTLGNLPSGKWRELTADELQSL